MTRWQCPSGPLNVWKVIDGFEKLENGTKRSVKFSIQDVPDNEHRRKEVFDLLHTYYLPEEPISKSLSFKEDSDGIKSLEGFWNYGMDQGVTIGCYKIDPDGEIGELAGVNVLFICTEETFADFFQMKDALASSNAKKMWKLFEKFTKNVDAFKFYNTDIYIGSACLSVKPSFRGQSLGYHILDARSAMGKKYGIPATSSMFTSPASQKLAKRAKFEETYSLNFVDFLDDQGIQVFPNIENYSKTVRMMGRKFN